MRRPPGRLPDRWRESVAAGTVAALGLALGLGWLGATPAAGLVGLALALGGGGWLIAALRRARLGEARRRGPGIVGVREGAIGYFGPETGGLVARDALAAVEIVPGEGGSAFWRLHRDGEAPLDVPAGAEGSDGLLDALVALPGFRAETARRALDRGRDEGRDGGRDGGLDGLADGPVTVWTRAPDATRRLGR